MLLIAADAIKGFSEHKVEHPITSAGKQRLITGAEMGGSRYAAVRICCGHRPTLAH